MIEKQDRIDKTHYMMLSALQEEVKSRMLIIRNKQVILDSDVAKLYGIETKAVNQAVKRNADKFPSDICSILRKKMLNICGHKMLPQIYLQKVASCPWLLQKKDCIC